MMGFWDTMREIFRGDGYILLLLFIGGTFLFAQFLVTSLCFAARSEQARGAVFRLALGLAWSVPIVIVLLLVMDLNAARLAPLEALSNSNPAEKAVLLAAGISSSLNSQALGGLELIGAAILGSAGVLVNWFRKRTIGPVSNVSWVASMAFCLIAAVVGTGLVSHSLALIRGFSMLGFADASEKLLLLARIIDDAPGLCVPSLLSLLVLLGATVSILWMLKKDSNQRMEGLAMAGGISVLLLGAAVFLSTRGHARDVRSLPEMLKATPGSQASFLIEDGISLPTLRNSRELEMAPVIVIGNDSVICDGRSMGAFENIVKDESPDIADLSELLNNLKRNYLQLHPNKTFPGKIVLQADVNAPGNIVAKILLTCSRSGYSRVDLATAFVRKVQSGVYGELSRLTIKGLPIELIEEDVPDAIGLPDRETLGQWAEKLDEAAGKGEVRIRM